MAKLARTVHLTNPQTRRVEVFGAGSELPDWADGMVTNRRAFEGDEGAALSFDDTQDSTGEPWPEQDDADGPPARSAKKPEWVAYAVAQGYTEADAEALTKDDLIDRLG